MSVTSLDKIKELAHREIQLPGFIPNQPLVVIAQRVSLLKLVSEGKIPNTLLGTAEELFYGKSSHKKEKSNQNQMKDMYDVIRIMAEATLLEPSMEDLSKIEVQLTDEQLIAIFNYSQKGVTDLSTFHQDTKNSDNNKHGSNVSEATK